MSHITLQYAALINLGGNPLVGLILLVILVALCVYGAIWLLDNLLAQFMAEPFLKVARFLIYAVGIIIVVDDVLKVVFGISLFGH